jgi:hypothetical protein
MGIEKKIGVIGVELQKTKVPAYKVLRCAYPTCFAEAKVTVSGSPFCRKHGDMAGFFLWIATQIRMKEDNVTKSGLIIPK